MRANLKNLRVIKNNLTQSEIAALIGVSRATYSFVERGERSGTNEFWAKIQQIFDVPDSEMWDLQKIDKEHGNAIRKKSSS